MNKFVVFLDIDGVLNFHRCPKDDRVGIDIGHWVSKNAINNLNELSEEADIDYVISSTWRKIFTLDELKDMFKTFGLKGNVIDVTPNLSFTGAYRGNEIQVWWGSRSKQYKDYVILDDDSDMLYWQKDNFIIVDPWAGVTPSTIWKIKKIFRLV